MTNPKQNFTTAVLTALTAITATAALSASPAYARDKKPSRPFCDLSIRPDIRSYEQATTVVQIDGRYDSTGRKCWWDVMLAPMVPFNAFWYADGRDGSEEVSEGVMKDQHNISNRRHYRHYMSSDSLPRAIEEYTHLKKECLSVLRKHYASDILFDDGADTVIAEHYFCSKPGINGVPGEVDPSEGNGGGNQYSIWIFRGTPVYGIDLTPEQKHAIRCEKLTSCYERALNSGDAQKMELVKKLNTEVGGCSDL
jgi:hypothetical protein